MINYEAEHYKMWIWLIAYPVARKAEYLTRLDLDDWPENLCFACEYARIKAEQAGVYSMCDFCPLGGLDVVGCSGGLYELWADAVSPEGRQELAIEIASLPWKEEEND